MVAWTRADETSIFQLQQNSKTKSTSIFTCKVFAVGVGLKPNGLKTMNQIAGNPTNAFNVKGGFDALEGVVSSIQDLLKKTVCGSCERLTQIKATEISVIEGEH